MGIKLNFPGMNSFNDLFIELENGNVCIKSANFGRTSFVERALINEIGREFKVDCIGCFFVSIPEKELNFEKLKEGIGKVRKAAEKYSEEKEKTEVLSVRIPSYLKSELSELSERYGVPVSTLIESLIRHYKNGVFEEFFHPLKERQTIPKEKEFGVITEKREFKSLFRKIDNLKPINKTLETLAKKVQARFKDGVLACSVFDKKNYKNLVVFFEKPKVNIYLNTSPSGRILNLNIIKKKTNDWNIIAEKAKKEDFKVWESLNYFSLYVSAKNVRETIEGIKKLRNFLIREKVEWGWWYKK